MKSIRTATLVPLMLCGALATITTVNGATHEIWAQAASSCTIDESHTGLANAEGARLKFAAGATGTIKARCNVTNPRDDGNNPEWNHFRMYYRDNDGDLRNHETGQDDINIKVVLYRVNRNGTQTELFTFNSSSVNRTNDTEVLRSININFDFETHAYYVEIEMKRNVVVDNPWNVSVSMVQLLDVF